jgi:hypothetical protein
LQEITRYHPINGEICKYDFENPKKLLNENASDNTVCTSFKQTPAASDLELSFVKIFDTVWSSALDSLEEQSDS